MRTAVLVLAIMAAVSALAIGLCSGLVISGLGGLSKNLGDISTSQNASAMAGNLLIFAFVEFGLALTGGIMAYRNWFTRKKTRLAAILMGIGALSSITNTFQALISGVMLLVATILTLVGGGKESAPI